mgnify:CR=1 FL=1
MKWETLPLASLGTVQTGSTPSTTEARFWEGGVPFVTPSELDQRFPITLTPRTLTEDGSREGRILQEGAVMVCCIGSLGKIGIAGRALVTNQQINSIEFDTKRIYPKYGYYACQRLKPKLISMAPATTVPIVNKSKFGQLEIPVPPLPEQIRIAAILDQADALRVKRREALAQLDNLTQAIFIEMFGDPVTDPKGWGKMTVSKLLEKAAVFVDGDWVESKDQDPEGEVRLVQLADIGDGRYINKSGRFLNKPTATRLKCTVLKLGDILIARMPDPLGRACLFPGDVKECVTVVDVCIIRTGENGPDPTWLMSCINSRSFRSVIAGEATGATRVRISRGNLSRLKIIAPPIELQREFSKRISVVERLKKSHSASLTELDNLFASLQHRAFRGEL